MTKKNKKDKKNIDEPKINTNTSDDLINQSELENLESNIIIENSPSNIRSMDDAINLTESSPGTTGFRIIDTDGNEMFMPLIAIYKKTHLDNIANTIGVKKVTLRTTLYGKNLNRGRFYDIKKILKRNGDIRVLHAVKGALWYIQKQTHEYLSNNFQPHSAAKGFIKEGGIVKHAMIHRNKKLIASFDIKDFFPSITFSRVLGMFQSIPFEFSKDEATVYAQICCLPEKNGSLPQGGITSPFISNMICRKLDSRLLKYANIEKFHYSRYADDLTFSTNKNFNYSKLETFISQVLEEEGFLINKSKSRLMRKSDRQVITGVVVNEGLNVNRKYIRSLRALIYNCEKNTIYKEAIKDSKKSENNRPWDRISCSPFMKDGSKIYNVNLNPLKYKDIITGKLLRPKQQVIEHFKRHVNGRLNHIKYVAQSNPDIIIQERRLAQINRMIKKWELVCNNDDYLKQFKTNNKFIYKLYDIERNRVKSASNHDELNEIIKHLINDKNDFRFFGYSYEERLDEKKEQLLNLLKFPPQSIEKTQLFLTNLSQSSIGVLAKMVHRLAEDEQLNIEEIENQYKDFVKEQYFLSKNFRDIIDNFFIKYRNYFKENELESLNPEDHPKLWDDLIIDFKNKTRFYSRKENEESIVFNEFIRGEVESKNNNYKKKKHIIIDNINNSHLCDIYTDVKSAKIGISYLINSLLKNSSNNSNISFKSYNEKSIDHLFIIENDNDDQLSINDWINKKCFHGKLKSALRNLNGLANWYITFNSDRGGRVTYDVMNNDIECNLHKEGNGFKHTLVFPGPKS